jgi:hypothetical protein
VSASGVGIGRDQRDNAEYDDRDGMHPALAAMLAQTRSFRAMLAALNEQCDAMDAQVRGLIAQQSAAREYARRAAAERGRGTGMPPVFGQPSAETGTHSAQHGGTHDGRDEGPGNIDDTLTKL